MKRYVWIAVAALILLSGVYSIYQYRRLTQKTDMSRYAPADCLVYVEFHRVSDLMSSLFRTRAWMEVSPAFGISRQTRSLESLTDLLAATGLATDDSLGLLLAEYALVVDSIRAETSEAGELEVVPGVTLLIETRSNDISHLVKSKSEMLARRVYGRDLQVTVTQGRTEIYTYASKEPDRYLLATHYGSLILISNQRESLERCLKAIEQGRTLSQDAAFVQARSESAVFAYATPAGINRLVQLALFSLNPEQAVASEQMVSGQAISSLTYSIDFLDGGVREQFRLRLRSDLAARLRQAFQPVAGSSEILRLARRADLWLLRAPRPLEKTEQLVETFSASSNVVVAFAIRQLLIDFERRLAVDRSVDELLGDELGALRMDAVERVKFLKVRDKIRILPYLARYLQSPKIESEFIDGYEVLRGSDGRAAVFVGDYLLVGERESLVEAIAAWSSRDASYPQPQGTLICAGPSEKALGDFFLRVSRLLRTTDGSREYLKRPGLAQKLSAFPSSTSVGRFTSEGLLIESNSPLGPFPLIASLAIADIEELREEK